MDITVKKHIGRKLNNYDDIRGISESLVCVRRNGNWGFINEEGKEVVKPIYDNAHCFSEGLARVEINDKWGFINKDGEEVIKPIYDDVCDFQYGLARVQKIGKYGLVNKEGKEVVKPIYNDIVYDEKIAIVKKNNSLYIVDLNIPTYEVSVDSQDRIIKRQFSNENEADEFKDYIKVYIDKQIKRKDKEEDELTEVFMALEKQYEEDLLEINNHYMDNIEKELNNCYKKSMN